MPSSGFAGDASLLYMCYHLLTKKNTIKKLNKKLIKFRSNSPAIKVSGLVCHEKSNFHSVSCYAAVNRLKLGQLMDV